MNRVRILLADDHTLMRAGIRSLLEKIPGVEVVGEAADGREALGLVKTRWRTTWGALANARI